MIFMFIIFSGLAYYLYGFLYKPNTKFVTNNEYKDVNKSIEAGLILFYTTWCPHCKKTRDKWDTLKVNSKYKNSNYIISFTEIDCDKQSSYADTFNIKEYPTIVLVRGDKKYIYDANLSEESLDLFINTIMNE